MRTGMRGFALLEVAIAALLLTLGAIWMASRLSDDVHDAGARATAAYMLAVRGATQEMLVQYFDVLAGYPPAPAGIDENPPPLPGYLVGPMPLSLGVSELQQSRGTGWPGFLPAGFPAAPPYGESVRVHIQRDGDCPGPACRLEAMVHTIAALKAGPGADYSPELVGAFMLSAGGYGGHAPGTDPQRLRGALFDVPNPAGAVAGVVAVAASLDTTLFNQFVRQGDTRPVWLRNRLDVAGVVSTSGGLALTTAVEPGGACTIDGLYAATARQSLASCMTGVWFELTEYVVKGQVGDLAHGAALPDPVCPSAMQPFVRVALQHVDVTLAGEDIDVRGAIEGTVSGSGNVNQSGSVSVSGSFGGTVYSTSDSRIRIAQGVGMVNGALVLNRAGPQARAYAIYGCRHV